MSALDGDLEDGQYDLQSFRSLLVLVQGLSSQSETDDRFLGGEAAYSFSSLGYISGRMCSIARFC